MKKLLFLFSFLIINSSLLISQNTWIQTYQPFGDVDYFPEDIVVCQDSGYAVNGYYYYYDPEFGIEEEWGFLMKTDSDGNLLWAKLDTLSFMGETRSNAFVETSDGGFISAISNGILIKRDSNGNREWITQCDIGINSMSNTSDGSIILGGASYLNIALSKIDDEGNTIWTQVYPIDDDDSICKSIIQTQDGGYALTGCLEVSGTMTGDIIVMKTDTNGDSLWTRTYDGYGGWDRGKSITEDSNNNILVAGSINVSGTTGFLWYLDEEGNTIWTQEVDGNVGYSHYSILSLPDNSFVAYCYKGNRESQIYNFDNNYNIQWEGILDGFLGQGDRSFSSDGEYFLCLLWEVGGFMEDNIGIAKTDSQGQVSAIDHDEIPYIDEITLSNYPNPFNPSTTISFNIYEPAKVELDIFNIKGQKIKTLVNENLVKGIHEVLWNCRNDNNKSVSSGVYFYKLSVNGKDYSVKKCLMLK